MKQITFQSVFDTPAVRMGSMNMQGQTPDGRIWEYLKATEIISQYMIVSNPANLDVDTVASSQNGAGQNVYIKEAAADWTVGAYQDHWLLVDDGTGEGQVAKIKDNTADTLELYTDYALATALTVAGVSDIVIRHEPDAEKVAITTQTTPCKGVAQVAYAADDYGWFLKKGIGGVLAGEAITINIGITPGDNTEGTGQKAVTTEGSFDTNTIARCLVANTNADKACLAMVNIVG